MPLFHWETITGSDTWNPSLERMPVEGGMLYRTTTYAPVFAQQVTFAPTPVQQAEKLVEFKQYEQGSYDTDKAWIQGLCAPLGLDPETDGQCEIEAAVAALVAERDDLKGRMDTYNSIVFLGKP